MVCEPIRVCSRNSYSCSVCIDNQNSTTCVCNPGFRRNGTECININECDDGTYTCSVNKKCIDKEGYYTCSCNEGYVSNGESCNNIDECATNSHSCPVNSTCIDTGGSYICACYRGYIRFAGNETICECSSGYIKNGTSCENINECESGEHNCSEHAKCTDILGSYSCDCNQGFA